MALSQQKEAFQNAKERDVERDVFVHTALEAHGTNRITDYFMYHSFYDKVY